jgi:hypothetical protein
MFEDYELYSGKDKQFRKHVKLNINRQLLLQNLAVADIVVNFLAANYYLLEEKKQSRLSNKQRQSFKYCFEYLLVFC